MRSAFVANKDQKDVALERTWEEEHETNIFSVGVDRSLVQRPDGDAGRVAERDEGRSSHRCRHVVEFASSAARKPAEGAAGQSTQPLNIAGTYRCGPDTKACQWLGTTITVTQSGTKLEIKSEKGDTAIGELMGNVGATAGPPMNMIAAISADGRTLDWSNGTKWTKQ